MAVTALSKREWVIARMFGGGFRKKEIALILGLKQSTVEGYLKRVRVKLRARGLYVIDSLDLCILIDKGKLEWVHHAIGT